MPDRAGKFGTGQHRGYEEVIEQGGRGMCVVELDLAGVRVSSASVCCILLLGSNQPKRINIELNKLAGVDLSKVICWVGSGPQSLCTLFIEISSKTSKGTLVRLNLTLYLFPLWIIFYPAYHTHFVSHSMILVCMHKCVVRLVLLFLLKTVMQGLSNSYPFWDVQNYNILTQK